MNSLPYFLFCCLMVGTQLVSLGQAPAPPAGTPAAPLNPLTLIDSLQAADEAYKKGDWAVAGAKYLEYSQAADQMKITENQDILYFRLGFCFAQTKNWDASLEFLKKYETKFVSKEFFVEVSFMIGKIHALKPDFPAAVSQFEKLYRAANAAIKEQAAPLLAEAYEKSDKKGDAVRIYEEYIKDGVNSTERINASLRLADIYFETDVAKGVNLLDRIKNSPSAADFVVILNDKAIQAAVRLMEADSAQPSLALVALQAVRRKKEVLQMQSERNEIVKQKLANWKALVKLSPRPTGMPSPSYYQDLVDAGEARLRQLDELVEIVKKDEGYDAVVIYQIGRCFYKLNRYWEADLAFRTIIKNYPSFPHLGDVYYGLISTKVKLRQNEEALELCKKFLKDHPTSPRISIIAEQTITLALETKDLDLAKRTADEVLKSAPKDADIKRLMLVAIGVEFETYDFKSARAKIEEFRKRFPPSPTDEESKMYGEEMDYRHALTYFFENNYAKTIELLGKYVKDHPAGMYYMDARYRINMVGYGEQQSLKTKAGAEKKLKEHVSNFQPVIDDVRDIISKQRKSPDATKDYIDISGELYALLGDCYDQMTNSEAEKLGIDRTEQAATAYQQGALKANKPDVLDYCMEQARTKLQAIGNWKEIKNLYEAFMKNHPQHPDRLKAIFWVCKATRAIGNDGTPEARDAALVKVKQVLSTEILAAINRPSGEGVEGLIEQLAQACVPKRKLLPMTVSDAKGDPKAAKGESKAAPIQAPAPPAAEEDPFEVGSKELDKWLKTDSDKINETGKARIAFGKILLYQMVPAKRDPENPKKRIDRAPEVAKMMDALAKDAKPEHLSSRLLAIVGEHLLKAGNAREAELHFNRLLQSFPKSDFVDYAHVGLGTMAFEQKDYPAAEKYFIRARDEMPGMKYFDALIGVGKSQFMQRNYVEPLKEGGPLLGVIGAKEAPPELKAEALFWLGECAYAVKDYTAAANHYQRIFISFGKYPNWVIKGYMGASTSFLAIGDRAAAGKHLNEAIEYLVKRKLQASPLMQVVRDHAKQHNLTLGG